MPARGRTSIGGHAHVTVNAAYYAGGGLPDAPVTWTATARPGHYTPPNRDDFTFGTWVPWWETVGPEPDRPLWEQTFAGRTDAAGRHTCGSTSTAAIRRGRSACRRRPRSWT